MGAALPLISGGMSLLGGLIGNRQNVKEAEKNRNFQAQQAGIAREFDAGQASINRGFQHDEAGIARGFEAEQVQAARDFDERMSNTAWQRGVQDMRMAGINPMLAFSQGGASSPSSPMGSASAPGGDSASSPSPSGGQARMEDVISPAVSSAIHMNQMLNEVKQIQQQTDDAHKTAIQQRANIFQDTLNKGLQSVVIGKDANIKDADLERIKNYTDLLGSQKKAADLANQTDALDLSRETSTFGKGMYWVDRVRSALFGGGSLMQPLSWFGASPKAVSRLENFGHNRPVSRTTTYFDRR